MTDSKQQSETDDLLAGFTEEQKTAIAAPLYAWLQAEQPATQEEAEQLVRVYYVGLRAGLDYADEYGIGQLRDFLNRFLIVGRHNECAYD